MLYMTNKIAAVHRFNLALRYVTNTLCCFCIVLKATTANTVKKRNPSMHSHGCNNVCFKKIKPKICVMSFKVCCYDLVFERGDQYFNTKKE